MARNKGSRGLPGSLVFILFTITAAAVVGALLYSEGFQL